MSIYVSIFPVFNPLSKAVKDIQIYHMHYHSPATSEALVFPPFSITICLALLQHPLINVPIIFIFRSQEWENKFDSPLNLS